MPTYSAPGRPGSPRSPTNSPSSLASDIWTRPGAFPMHTENYRPYAALFASDEATGPNSVRIQFEDRTLCVREGTTVAAALLLHAAGPFRTTPVKSAPRAPYCMMGVCFD